MSGNMVALNFANYIFFFYFCKLYKLYCALLTHFLYEPCVRKFLLNLSYLFRSPSCWRTMWPHSFCSCCRLPCVHHSLKTRPGKINGLVENWVVGSGKQYSDIRFPVFCDTADIRFPVILAPSHLSPFSNPFSI